MSTSFGMSPIVAICSARDGVAPDEVLDDATLVRLRVRDVEVVRLRARRGDVVAELVVRRRLGLATTSKSSLTPTIFATPS